MPGTGFALNAMSKHCGSQLGGVPPRRSLPASLEDSGRKAEEPHLPLTGVAVGLL
jgi:hypothetical protein